MINVFDKLGNKKQLLESSDIECGDGYIKFSNGILICFGIAYAQPGEASGYFNYPVNFITTPRTVAVHNWAHESKGTVTVGNRDNAKVEIFIYDDYNGTNLERHSEVISIGRWK